MAEICPHDGKAHHYFIVQYTGTCQKCGAIKEFPRQPMKGCFGTIWLGRREPAT